MALGCDEFYAQWLLLLALERLGIATGISARAKNGLSFLAGERGSRALEPHFPP